MPVAGKKYKYFPDRDLIPPTRFKNLNMPERHRLPIMPKTPNFWAAGRDLVLGMYIHSSI